MENDRLHDKYSVTKFSELMYLMTFCVLIIRKFCLFVCGRLQKHDNISYICIRYGF